MSSSVQHYGGNLLKKFYKNGTKYNQNNWSSEGTKTLNWFENNIDCKINRMIFVSCLPWKLQSVWNAL